MQWEILFLSVLAIAFVSSTSTDSKTEQERFLLTASSVSFSTFTLVKSTTTTTSTLTITTTCTTSTATILTCTTGRRRRGLFYNEAEAQIRHRRAGLFYNDDEVDEKEGAIFLPSPSSKTISDPVDEVPAISATVDQVVPLELESGFSIPEGTQGNRFLLAFGISTSTSIVLTTSTVSLTAICSSTTGFPLCGSSGK